MKPLCEINDEILIPEYIQRVCSEYSFASSKRMKVDTYFDIVHPEIKTYNIIWGRCPMTFEAIIPLKIIVTEIYLEYYSKVNNILDDILDDMEIF